MSRKHPTLQQLERKRANIGRDLERNRPVPTFEQVLQGRKHRHSFTACADQACALRTHTPEQITDLLIGKQLDLTNQPTT